MMSGENGDGGEIWEEGAPHGDTVKYEIKVPLGPVHPAVKEPILFTFTLKGEEIVDVDFEMGFIHRGIEKLVEKKNFVQALYLLERICGICSNVHPMAYAQAVEEIWGVKVPERALYIRTIMSELERIHSHMLLLGLVAHQMGFDTMLMYTWRERERVMDLFEAITGNRVNYSLNMIGGVRWDIEKTASLLKAMDDVEKSAKYCEQVFLSDRSVEKRTHGVGYISGPDARELGVVGPNVRGSGVPFDIRLDVPYAAYPLVTGAFKARTASGGDSYSRTKVRIDELYDSCSIIRSALDDMPRGPIVAEPNKMKIIRSIPAGEAVGRVEAPRGENVHYVQTDGHEFPRRVKVRAPTFANVYALRKMLTGGQLADAPVVVASIDVCFSCTDRVAVVDAANPKRRKVVSMEQIAKRGGKIRW